MTSKNFRKASQESRVYGPRRLDTGQGTNALRYLAISINKTCKDVYTFFIAGYDNNLTQFTVAIKHTISTSLKQSLENKQVAHTGRT